jgi:hypothetical protein
MSKRSNLFLLTWDNAKSKKLREELSSMGMLILTSTKTTALLLAYPGINYKQVREVVKAYLNPDIGSAVYMNQRSGKVFELSNRGSGHWRRRGK